MLSKKTSFSSSAQGPREVPQVDPAAYIFTSYKIARRVVGPSHLHFRVETIDFTSFSSNFDAGGIHRILRELYNLHGGLEVSTECLFFIGTPKICKSGPTDDSL